MICGVKPNIKRSDRQDGSSECRQKLGKVLSNIKLFLRRSSPNKRIWEKGGGAEHVFVWVPKNKLRSRDLDLAPTRYRSNAAKASAVLYQR